VTNKDTYFARKTFEHFILFSLLAFVYIPWIFKHVEPNQGILANILLGLSISLWVVFLTMIRLSSTACKILMIQESHRTDLQKIMFEGYYILDKVNIILHITFSVFLVVCLMVA
jgi:accessory gene regulator protein AgrB